MSIIDEVRAYLKKTDKGKILLNDQRSVTDQLQDLAQLAVELGLYDAADWLNNQLKEEPRD